MKLFLVLAFSLGVLSACAQKCDHNGKSVACDLLALQKTAEAKLEELRVFSGEKLQKVERLEKFIAFYEQKKDSLSLFLKETHAPDPQYWKKVSLAINIDIRKFAIEGSWLVDIELMRQKMPADADSQRALKFMEGMALEFFKGGKMRSFVLGSYIAGTWELSPDAKLLETKTEVDGHKKSSKQELVQVNSTTLVLKTEGGELYFSRQN